MKSIPTLVYILLNYISIIFSGGITLTFYGTNFDIVQSPLLEITDSRFNQTLPMVSLVGRMTSKMRAIHDIWCNKVLSILL